VTPRTDTGNMGAILVRGGSLEVAPDVSQYPYVKGAGQDLGPGVFVAARTAIDANTGVAADHKLFFQEMVVPGARFGLRLTLIADRTDDEHKRRDALVNILAALADERGMVCGRGQADGSGALRLREKVTVVERKIDTGGRFTESQTEIVLPRAAAPRTLVFVCKGPFLSADASWNPDAERGGGDPEKQVPQVVYQHGAGNQPLELGSQIAGVLRARARWIMGLKALVEGVVDPEEIIEKVDPGEGGKDRVVKTRDDVERLGLTPVERLFGVSGFAGLLSIEKMRFSDAKEYEITSVRLDHFSGAPIDKALFTTRAVIGTQLEFELALRGRRDADPEKRTEAATPTPDDNSLFEALTKDIEKNGLMLGHGSGKGFGWFETPRDG
jgi:hypothetical protein